MKTAETPRVPPTATAIAVLAALVFLVYWPGLGGGFAFDDMPNIVENLAIHVDSLRWSEWVAAIFSSPASELRRPLASLSFALNHYFTGLDARPMKLTNIGIHALNAFLVYGLAREILRCLPAGADRDGPTGRVALLIAALWALNPINLMAVLYVVQRMESLSHVFVFAALWTYVGMRRRRPMDGMGLLLAAAVLAAGTLLGLLAKESAALLPLYAAVLEVTVLKDVGATGDRRRGFLLLFTAVLAVPAIGAVASFLPRVLSPSAFRARDFNLAERLLTEGRVVVDYFRWSVLPDLNALGLYHDDYVVSRGLLSPPSTLACLLLIGLAAAAAWAYRKRRPLASLGILWFLSAHLLTGTFLPLELVFEHRNYFASLGVALLLAAVLGLDQPAVGRRPYALPAGLMLLAIHGGATWLRASEWSDPLRFAISEAAKHPLSPRATYERARMYVIASQYDRSSRYDALAVEALDQARRVPGASALPAQAAIMFDSRTGRPQDPEAWHELAGHLGRRVGLAELSAMRSLVECSNAGLCPLPPGRMLAVFAAGLTSSDSAELLNLYGNYVLNTLHDAALAERAWVGAIERNPVEPQYRANLARLLVALGRHDEARQQLDAMRRLGRLGQYDSLAESILPDVSGESPLR